MPELLTAVGTVTLIAGVVMHALARDSHRRATALFGLARKQLADASDLLDRSGQVHADALRLTIDARREKVDGPSALSRLLARRFDLDTQLAVEIANTAVFHFESPLAEAMTDPKLRHPWAARS